MATIQENLEKIKTAVYGEEVRGAIHDSIEQMNGIVINSESKVEQYGTQINEAVEKANTATNSATDAAGKANTAASSANTAATSANDAAKKATDAASSAGDAAGKANMAAGKANTAATSANDAATSATTAASSANTAASSATTAATSATDAAGKANTAASSANTAATEANKAKDAANTATSSATTAASSANDAAKKANDAATSATTAASSATTATTNANNAADRANAAAKAAEDIVHEENIASRDYVNEQIDAIDIGGMNMLPLTNQGITNWGWGIATGGVTWTEELHNGIRCAKATRNDVENTGFSVIYYPIINTNRIMPSAQYALSFDVYPNVSTKIGAQLRAQDGTKSLCPRTAVNVEADKWNHCIYNINTLDFEYDDLSRCVVYITDMNNSPQTSYIFKNLKLEAGNKPTSWSPAPEDTDHAISRRSTVTYDYGGANLEEVFDGSFEKLHEALAAEDYTHIHVGDYWPITLNGTFGDYGSYLVKPGAPYYLSKNIHSESVGQVTENRAEGSLVGTNTYGGTTVDVVSFIPTAGNHIGITCYASGEDCFPYYPRTMNNVQVKLEVAGINHYWRYGDSGELASDKPHIVFVSRDCLPFPMKMRKASVKWEDETATNPWLGSALYRTLNEIGSIQSVYTLLMNVQDKKHENVLGSYIYGGPNFLGMRALMETKAQDAANATGWAWYDRGKLFLPSVLEVFGNPLWSQLDWNSGLGNQFAIFRDSRRHIAKGIGDGGSRTTWWTSSSAASYTTAFVRSNEVGHVAISSANDRLCLPICFIFAKEAL